MKLLGLGFTSQVRRAACIACMPFVFVFIAFNLLDLDGSNLASLTKSFDRFVIDAELGAVTKIDPLPERFENFENDHRFLTLHDSSDRVRYQIIELRALSRLEKARTHLYHVSLPRESVPG
ncbi:MAG: hypothetical protein ACTHLX_14895 [Candidatus Binatia bacterium]